MTTVKVNTAVSNAALQHLIISAMEASLASNLEDLMENYLSGISHAIHEGQLEETLGISGDGVVDIVKEIVRECYVEMDSQGQIIITQ